MSKIQYSYHCHVCGCELDFLPWDGGTPSYEIYPCCYMQFGYDDAAGGETDKRIIIAVISLFSICLFIHLISQSISI